MGCVRLAGLVKEPELRWLSTCWKRCALRPGQSQIETV